MRMTLIIIGAVCLGIQIARLIAKLRARSLEPEIPEEDRSLRDELWEAKKAEARLEIVKMMLALEEKKREIRMSSLGLSECRIFGDEEEAKKHTLKGWSSIEQAEAMVDELWGMIKAYEEKYGEEPSMEGSRDAQS